MNNYLIQYNSDISIQNSITKKFISIDSTNKIINVKGIHPIFKPKFKIEEKMIIKNINNKDSNNYINCNDSILISNLNNLYLSASSTGEVIVNNLENDFSKERLFKFNIWFTEEFKNKKQIMQFDEVLLKSPYGSYLSSDENGNICSSKIDVDDYCKWQIFNSNSPPFPDWLIFRPNISNFNLLTTKASFFDNKLKISSVNNKNRLNVEIPADLKTQELILINELLFALMGNEGDYIKKVYNSPNNYSYILLKNDCINDSIHDFVNKILPLATFYEKVILFESIKSNFNQGFINQALSSGLKELKKEYLLVINMLDTELKNNNLNLQKLYLWIQPIWKIFSNLNDLLEELNDLKGGKIINTIFNYIQNSVDDQLKNMYNFLFSKCLFIYLEILSKWIFYGILDDDYEEFFIKEKNLDINFEEIKFSENYWDSKYFIDKENVPQFYEKIVDKIFLTGKYLNVIKVWDPQRRIPFFNELNITNDYGNYDIFDNLDKVYNWANIQIINIMLIENDFILRLKTIKSFLFFDTGDFLSFFIDFSEKELNKNSNNVNIDKLNNYLYISIRYSILNKNKFKDQISCDIKPFTLIEMLKSFKTLNKIKNSFLNDNKKEDNSFKAFKYLSLNFKMDWPNNLIFSENSMCIYQIINKCLWSLKYHEYQLSKFWKLIHSLKYQNNHNLFKYIQIIINKMLFFIKGLFQYIAIDIIDNQFNKLIKELNSISNNLKNSNNIWYNFEDIIGLHQEFLNNIMNESLIFEDDFSIIIVNFFSLIYLFCSKIYNYIDKKIILDIKDLENYNEDDKNLSFYDKKRIIEENNSNTIKKLEEDTKFISTIKKYNLKYNDFIRDINEIIIKKQKSLDINYDILKERLNLEI